MIFNVRTITLIISIAATVVGLGNNKGRQFLLGFISNRVLVTEPVIRIYVTSEETGAVTFSVPLLYSMYPTITKKIVRNKVLVHEYPYALHMIRTDLNDKCILVNSNVDVTVQGASVNNLTSDAYLALPTWALGSKYYVMSYLYNGKHSRHSHGPSEFCVMALQNETEVTFHRPQGVTFEGLDSVVLRAFQGYQVQSSTSDLTGVKVTSTKPIAVVSGTDWTAVGGLYMGDHLVEQLLPTYTWGSQFLVPPLYTRSGGDVCRVIAAEDNTRVRATSARVNFRKDYILKAGEFADFDIPSFEPTHILANGGISVAQFSKSYLSDNNRLSDPMMMMIPSIQMYATSYTFSPIQTIPTFEHQKQDVSFANYLSLIIPTRILSKLKFDYHPISTEKYVQHWPDATGNGETFTILTIKVTNGFHIISNTEGVPFGAFLYGFKFQEAYGLSVGRNITMNSYVCSPTLTFRGDYFDNDCDGRIDEEIENGIDDDNDGFIDEDLQPADPEKTTMGFTTASPASTTSPTTTESEKVFSSPTQAVNEENNGGKGEGSGDGGAGGTGSGSDGEGGGSDHSVDTASTDSDIVSPTRHTLPTQEMVTARVVDVSTTRRSTDGQTGRNISNEYSTVPYSPDSTSDITVASNDSKSNQGSSQSSSVLTPTDIGSWEETNSSFENGVPEGIRCNGFTCNLTINGTSIDWNSIRSSPDHNESFGVYWQQIFWLFQGDIWWQSPAMTELFRSTDQYFCLLIIDKIWCYNSMEWSFLLEVSGSHDLLQGKMSLITDDGSWLWEDDSISTTNNYELIRLFSILASWNGIPEGKRLGIVRNTHVWVFGKGTVNDLSNANNSNGVTIHWKSNAWTWDGSEWNNDSDSVFALNNNTFSIFWNGFLYRWNGSGWEVLQVPGLPHTPGSEGVVFSWNNKTWSLDRASGPREVSDEITGMAGQNQGPIVALNESRWILTPEGNWVLIEDEPKPPPLHLFDPVLCASWGDQFWIYNTTTKMWVDSIEHREGFLMDDPVIPRPGILSGGVYWQWNGTNWNVLFERLRHENNRRKREIPAKHILTAWWDEEAWTLFESKWSKSKQSLSDVVELDDSTILPVLVLSVDGDIWVYNGSNWGLNREGVRLTVGNAKESHWRNVSLGFVTANHTWLWYNKTLTGDSVLVEGLQIDNLKQGDVGVITEGTLWVLGENDWSDSIFLSNSSHPIEGETQLGVLANDTLWIFKENHWATDNRTVDIPKKWLENKPAVIVNDTLWILDKVNPNKHDLSYVANDAIINDRLSDVNVIWHDQLWSYSEANHWTNSTISESQNGDFPNKGILIYGRTWSLHGPSVISYENKTGFSRNSESFWHTLKLHYLNTCHEWVNHSFSIRQNCLTEEEKEKTSGILVVILNETKWAFVSNSHWVALNETTQGANLDDWVSHLGIIVNETIWLWNGSDWIQLSIESGEIPSYVTSSGTVTLFWNGQFWNWNGKEWVRQIDPSALGDFLVPDTSNLTIDFNGSSWIWNGTHIIPQSGAGKEHGGGFYIEVIINGTSWVCNENNCHQKSDEEEILKDRLANYPIGTGVNATIWVWNGTAWVDGNDLSTQKGGQAIFIYVDGEVYLWNGTSFVKADSNMQGLPDVAFPSDDNASNGGSTTASYKEGDSLFGVKVTINGSIYTWDGNDWIDEDGKAASDLPVSKNTSIILNGTKWVWSGSSWIAASPVHDNTMDVSTSTTGKYQQTVESSSYTTVANSFTTPTRGDTDTSIFTDITRTTGISETEDTLNDTHDVFANTTYLPNTTGESRTDDGLGEIYTDSVSTYQTQDVSASTDEAHNISATNPNVLPPGPTPKEPKDPDLAAATGNGTDNKIVIIIVVVLLIIFLIILIIVLCCWCSKRKKRKAARQKVNPAVATEALPRPNSQYQDPPTIRSMSSGSFNDPRLLNSSRWSSSSSSLGQRLTPTASRRYSSGRRSPRVSQAPPVDLPDLIISLPPGKHIHLRSPRLSPDPSPPSGQVLTSDV